MTRAVLLTLGGLLACCGWVATTTAAPKRKDAPTVPSDTLITLPPETRLEDVVETIHGVSMRDPYRWLEDDRSTEVRQWTGTQNAYTRLLLDAVPGRDYIRERLSQLMTIGTIDAPKARGGRLFYLKRSGDQEQPVLYLRDSGGSRVLIDPNTLSGDGTTALDWWYPSPDGLLVAWGSSRNGDEWSTLRVRDVDTGRDRIEEIPRTRAASVAWLPDATGFYYTRYPDIGDVPRGDENYHRRIFRHLLDTDHRADSLIFGDGRAPEDWVDVQISRDGRWLLASVSIGWDRTELYLTDRQAPVAGWRTLVAGEAARYEAHFGSGEIFLWTNAGAPRGRLYRVDPAAPERAGWVEIVPEGPDALTSVSVIAGRLFLHYLHLASSRVVIVNREGVIENPVTLPLRGTVACLNGESDGTEAYLLFHSYFVPPIVYRVDPATGGLTEFDRVAADIDSSAYVVNQVTYPSKDGTPVSMFLVHKKGLKKNGTNPTLLYGYGGFNQSLVPGFQRNSFLWLEQGGVLAIANLRGGGEYGEAWHQAGTLDRKQNVFDDYLAAAEWLIKQKYTSSSKLVAQGGSNGGLLVGAALVQKPDLFRAVVCQVPLLDMLRYHQFLVARLWIPEYGTAEDSTQFEYLRRYSPYQNVKDGTVYPAILLATAESDSRVAPLHARKMTARLQAASTSGRPVLLRLETRAGHGAGKPVRKLVEEYTDIWSFVFAQIGMAPKAPGAATAKKPAAKKPAAKKTAPKKPAATKSRSGS
ncbi:MAG: prolyl oligopeptidase family serine peptidase [Candidatus Eisenbacteria bacterium]|nr:prolyl oligopeptidase family serine peptidase [Candidatus Eisenbacteria bacterium]